MKILLVEDDPRIGAAVQEGLRRAGFTVDWTRDGQAAELALTAETYALMLLDLGLPRKSGLDLLAGERRRGNIFPCSSSPPGMLSPTGSRDSTPAPMTIW